MLKKRRNLRDIILGSQDGLLNLLGVILAIALATDDIKVVIISGLAVTFAESLSIAAVAYTSSKAAHDYHKSLIEEEFKEIKSRPKLYRREVETIYRRKGFIGNLLETVVKKITLKKGLWVKTLVEEKFGYEVDYEKPSKSAFIVGSSAIIGSIIPLIPFFFFNIGTSMLLAFIISIIVLFITGAYEARVTIGDWRKSGIIMVLIGIFATAVGYLIGSALSYL